MTCESPPLDIEDWIPFNVILLTWQKLQGERFKDAIDKAQTTVSGEEVGKPIDMIVLL